jgi:hypothetical protein
VNGVCDLCQSADQCAVGLGCRTATGECTACRTAMECRQGEACVEGACGPCVEGPECDGGLCNQDGDCVACMEGQDDGLCATQYDNEDFTCQDTGACGPTVCTAADQCHLIRQVCDLGEGICVPCRDNFDCLDDTTGIEGGYPLGTQCIEGVCVSDAPCESSTDCLSDRPICDETDHQCRTCHTPTECVDRAAVDASWEGEDWLCADGGFCVAGNCLAAGDCASITGEGVDGICVTEGENGNVCRACVDGTEDALCRAEYGLEGLLCMSGGCTECECRDQAMCAGQNKICVGCECVSCSSQNDPDASCQTAYDDEDYLCEGDICIPGDCHGQPDCTDSGLICNTHWCVACEGESADAQCVSAYGSNYICHNGVCVENICSTNSDCSDDKPICGNDGECRLCQQFTGECGVGKVCLANGRCVEGDCERRQDCLAGQVCGDDHFCRDCTDPDDDLLCQDQFSAAYLCISGQCKAADCHDHEDCWPDRKLCDADNACVGCGSDFECEIAYSTHEDPQRLCILGRCEPCECRETTDCDQGQVCRNCQCEDCANDSQCHDYGQNWICEPEGDGHQCEAGYAPGARCLHPPDIVECPENREDCGVAGTDNRCGGCGTDDSKCRNAYDQEHLCVAGVCLPGVCHTTDVCLGAHKICVERFCVACQPGGDQDARSNCPEGYVCDNGECWEGQCVTSAHCESTLCINHRCACAGDGDCENLYPEKTCLNWTGSCFDNGGQNACKTPLEMARLNGADTGKCFLEVRIQQDDPNPNYECFSHGAGYPNPPTEDWDCLKCDSNKPFVWTPSRVQDIDYCFIDQTANPRFDDEESSTPMPDPKDNGFPWETGACVVDGNLPAADVQSDECLRCDPSGADYDSLWHWYPLADPEGDSHEVWLSRTTCQDPQYKVPDPESGPWGDTYDNTPIYSGSVDDQGDPIGFCWAGNCRGIAWTPWLPVGGVSEAVTYTFSEQHDGNDVQFYGVFGGGFGGGVPFVNPGCYECSNPCCTDDQQPECVDYPCLCTNSPAVCE